MAGTVYNDFKRDLLEEYFDSNTIRVALVDDSVAYTPDVDAEEFVDDVLDGGTTAQELSGTGYTRKEITSKQFSKDTGDDEGVFDSTVTLTWSGLDTTEDIQGLLVYRQEGGDDTTPGDDPLVMYDETDSDLPLTTDGTDVNLDWNAEGILNAG